LVRRFHELRTGQKVTAAEYVMMREMELFLPFELGRGAYKPQWEKFQWSTTDKASGLANETAGKIKREAKGDAQKAATKDAVNKAADLVNKKL
jgi:hypothetical protein